MEFKQKISENISYDEATHSDIAIKKGITNDPNTSELLAMRKLAITIFEPLRKGIGNKPIKINSFFRSKQVNKIIPGSSLTSQHVKGEAMDIEGLGAITNKQLFDYIKNNLVFDQLIWEYGTDKEPAWVHVSYCSNRNRNQILYTTK